MSEFNVTLRDLGESYVEQHVVKKKKRLFELSGAGWLTQSCVTFPSVCRDQRETSTAHLMNDNKLPIVIVKVWCENAAHVTFIIKVVVFLLFFSLEWSMENVISELSSLDASVRWRLEYTASTWYLYIYFIWDCWICFIFIYIFVLCYVMPMWMLHEYIPLLSSQQIYQLRIRWLLSQMTLTGNFIQVCSINVYGVS